MQDEIDLRPYFSALLNHKWIILAGAIVGAIIGVGFVTLSPDRYQATALVAVLEPNEIIQLDPRFQSVQNETQLLRAFPELARSDGIMLALLADPAAAKYRSVGQLRNHLSAEASPDPGLLRLRAEHAAAAEAQQLVNAWARLFVSWVNGAYGNQLDSQYDYFAGQLEDASERLALAENALVEFQAQNRLTVIANEILALTELQAAYLARANELTLLQEDIGALQAQLESAPDVRGGLASQLTLLGLQSRAFGLDEDLPLFFQLSEGEILDLTPAEQEQFLESLSSSVTQMISSLAEDASALEPEMLRLQQEQQGLQAELNSLSRNQMLLEETTTSLARKVDEESIASQELGGGVRLVSEAAIPTSTTAPSMLLVGLIGGLFGLALVSFIILVAAWWRQ